MAESKIQFYWMGGMWGRGMGGGDGPGEYWNNMLMKVHDTLKNAYVNWKIIIRYENINN
jgi:hypothetical protein